MEILILLNYLTFLKKRCSTKVVPVRLIPQVSTSFLCSLTQNKFFVRLIDDRETTEYKGKYEAGKWEFEQPSIPDLKLKFPLRTWVSRGTVKSSSWASDIQEIMLAIAITVFIWFTWNAVPAD